MKTPDTSTGNIVYAPHPDRKPTLPRAGGLAPLKPQSQAVIDAFDRFKGKWKHHVGIARIVWGELSEDELLKTAGRKDSLATLIHQRYAMSLPAANDQVESLIGKCGY